MLGDMKILANEIELDVENADWRIVIAMLRGVVQLSRVKKVNGSLTYNRVEMLAEKTSMGW